MSFSNDIKQELAGMQYPNKALAKARAHGLVRFSKVFSKEKILLQTENMQVARLYANELFAVVGLSAGVTVAEYQNSRGKSFFIASVDAEDDREKILRHFGYGDETTEAIAVEKPYSQAQLGAFCAGAFLACGSIVDPTKSYRAELVSADYALLKKMAALLGDVGIQPKISPRRDHFVAYLKDSEEIEDLLTMMGAGTFSLELMNVKIYKSIRNRVNRVQNCEFANIEKTVLAAAEQIRQIEYILEKKGVEFLPDDLKEIAMLRTENPEMSLRELGEALPEALSRSGVNHRLKRLAKIYEEITE